MSREVALDLGAKLQARERHLALRRRREHGPAAANVESELAADRQRGCLQLRDLLKRDPRAVEVEFRLPCPGQ